ncbi:flagellar hook-length control protein FliK [Pantoea sp. MBD-2R]|uniref:flagellar hook-length control protein FliK n=1 Tax=unclassified Pantoea TaxID=2630326 RepID=UPI0011BEB5C8|nr:flagellar hook-length control protein FliK [Pantoea sp. CCBC3-3-1]
MITLPLVTSATKVASASTSGSTQASADVGTDTTTTASGVAGETAQTGGEGFLTLLGNKLLTLAQKGDAAAKTGVATTTATLTETSETDPSPKAKLNALLAALDKPETLNALLKPASVKEGDSIKSEKATDESETTAAATTTLSSSDMQSLQALFAMLPPTTQQPSLTAKAGETLEGDGSIKGSKQATLASLLSSDAKTTGSEDEAKNSDNNDKLVGAATLSTTTSTQKASSDTAALNTAFQQVLGQVNKDNDKENSSSSSTPTITSNVISAASAAMTPTTTSVVTAPAAPQLSSQLGSPEWQQALNQQIVMFSRNGQQTAELHLHPQDLGSIQISLKLDSDQAQLSMVSNHSQVRAALEAAMPQLRTALAENGINLGQANVSSDAFQQGQSFAGQQEQQKNNSRGNTFSLAAENDSDVTAIAVPAALQARAAGSSAVDIFA